MITFSCNHKIRMQDIPRFHSALGSEYLSLLLINKADGRRKGAYKSAKTENINVDAYGFKTRKGELLTLAIHEKPFISSGEKEAVPSGVIEETLRLVEDTVEDIVCGSDFSYEIKVLQKYCEKALVEEGIDILKVMKNVAKGGKDKSSVLKTFVEKYELTDIFNELSRCGDFFSQLNYVNI